MNEKQRKHYKMIMLRYVKYDRMMMEYRKQFFTSFRDGVVTHTATKFMTHEEILKLRAMDKKLRLLEKQYIFSMRKAINGK